MGAIKAKSVPEYFLLKARWRVSQESLIAPGRDTDVMEQLFRAIVAVASSAMPVIKPSSSELPTQRRIP